MNTVNQVEIKKADPTHRPFIISLLQHEKLPVADLPAVLDNFFVALHNAQVIGVIGLEQYDDCGLLRSMAVAGSHRNKGIAALLVKELEELAATQGIVCIYLFTETAHEYFTRKSYTTIQKDEVPQSIQASSEFNGVCPVSAIVMKKALV